MSLYNTISKRQLILAAIEQNDGELTDELKEQLTISDDRVQEGALELLGIIQTAESNITSAKTEKERLDEFIKSNERAKERCQSLLLSATIRQGSIEAGSYRLTTRPSVRVEFAPTYQPSAATGGKWVEPVDGFYKADKPTVMTLLKAGEYVPGASLEPQTNLIIK